MARRLPLWHWTVASDGFIGLGQGHEALPWHHSWGSGAGGVAGRLSDVPCPVWVPNECRKCHQSTAGNASVPVHARVSSACSSAFASFFFLLSRASYASRITSPLPLHLANRCRRLLHIYFSPHDNLVIHDDCTSNVVILHFALLCHYIHDLTMFFPELAENTN